MKNAIGTFFQPRHTYICLDFLATLDPGQMQNGMAEIVKIALLCENLLYGLLIQTGGQPSQEIVRTAIEEKLVICARDPYDRGERAKLNLGHTFGHLIETASDFTIPHGIAVAIGIRYAARFSREMGWLSGRDEEKIIDLLDRYRFPKDVSPDVKKRILSEGRGILLQDKKHRATHLRLVCMDGFRSVFLYDCDDVDRLMQLFEK